MTTMPFGKHKGRLLADVPSGYLQWLTESGALYGLLRTGIEAELARRAAGQEHRADRPPLRKVAGGRRPGPERSASARAAAERLLAASGGQLSRALAALLAVVTDASDEQAS
jgi:uncharacterized protein (DUF3820 family)